jgi:hypothetical protein
MTLSQLSLGDDQSPTGRTTIAAELRNTLQGSVWGDGDEGYDQARTVWNGAVDHRPAVVARCAHADDVRTALAAARRHQLPISVRGGGHDWAGRAIRDGGVVIDLSAMRAIRVDPQAAVAHIQGGVLAGELLDAAAAHGLATAAGAVRGVGMMGMTMAGGYGGLIGRFGLALDNLLSAEVVLADGSRLVAGPDGDNDLWWALRGGGGNFGVVTSARFQLHPLGPVIGGMVMYPFEQARQVLRGYREIIAAAPDELTVMAGFLTGPGGAPVVFVAPTWSGDLDAGATAVAPLTRLGTPVMSALQTMPYPQLLRMFEAGSAAGNQYALGTHWLPELTDEAITALAEGAATRSSPLSLLAVHQFHGAATRVSSDATAFAVRQPHLLAEVIAAWPPTDEAEQHLAWIGDATSALAPQSIPGGYPNILGPADSTRTSLGFSANVGRLRSAKRRYDPDNAFTAIAALTS